MANLVIKPATGAGNKVIFQNQAGNVDALTVDGAGAITIAGNTTLSGTANAIGTVTSGTLALTFPSGHIIQTKPSDYTNKRSIGSWVTSTSYSWSTYSCAITMTNCVAGNKIILMGTESGYQGEFDKSTEWTWFVKDGANNEVNISDLAESSGGMEGNNNLSSLYINNSAQDWGSVMGVNGWYIVQASSGASIEFRICTKVNTASTNIWNCFQSTGIGMEVQA